MKKGIDFIKPSLFLAGTCCTVYIVLTISNIATASNNATTPDPRNPSSTSEQTSHSFKSRSQNENPAYGDSKASHETAAEVIFSEPIRLVATFVSNQSTSSWAFFEKDGSLFLIAQEGHQINNNFYIYKIQNNQVLISNGNAIKALKLTSSESGEVYEKDEITLTNVDSEKKNGEPTSPRRQILNQLSLKPVSEGSASGYRVTEDSFRLIKKHGLKPGDIILSANGQPLGTESSDILAVKSFQREKKATVTVLRGSQTIYIDYTP